MRPYGFWIYAIGQFINYRIALEEEEADRGLYLAVPVEIYKRFFKYPFIQTVIRRNQIPLIIYDIEKEAIADQLVEKGVPKQEIVLAYHAPNVRKYTDFAPG